MGLIEILIGVIFVLAFGTGVAMTTGAESANEFMFARACYVVAALAIIAAYLWWLYEADRVAWQRIVVGIIAALIALVAMPEAVRWVNAREAAYTARQGPPASSPAEAANPATAINQQFYSQQDREKLANLYSELLGLLRDNGGGGGGNGAWRALATLGNDWQAKGGREGNITGLGFDVVLASQSVQALRQAIYGENGIRDRYQAYHNEFEQIFPPEEDYYGQFQSVVGAVAEFDGAVRAVVAEDNPAKRKSLHEALQPNLEKYTQVIQDFQRKLFDATQRVEESRKSLNGQTTASAPANAIGYNSRAAVLVYAMSPMLYKEAVELCDHMDAHGFVTLAQDVFPLTDGQKAAKMRQAIRNTLLALPSQKSGDALTLAEAETMASLTLATLYDAIKVEG